MLSTKSHMHGRSTDRRSSPVLGTGVLMLVSSLVDEVIGIRAMIRIKNLLGLVTLLSLA